MSPIGKLNRTDAILTFGIVAVVAGGSMLLALVVFGGRPIGTFTSGIAVALGLAAGFGSLHLVSHPIERRRVHIRSIVDGHLSSVPLPDDASGSARSTAKVGWQILVSSAIWLACYTLALWATGKPTALWSFVPAGMIQTVWERQQGRSWWGTLAKVSGNYIFVAIMAPSGFSWWLVLAGVMIVTSIFAEYKADAALPSPASEAEPAFREGRYGLASTLLGGGEMAIPLAARVRFHSRDYRGVERLIRRRLRIESDYGKAFDLMLILASSYRAQERFEAARHALDAARQIREALGDEAPAPGLATEAALLELESAGDAASALRLCEEVPGEVAVQAWVLAANGRESEALGLIDRLALDGSLPVPELSMRSYYAGKALRQCGDWPGALAFFEAAREAEPEGHYGVLAGREIHHSQ